MLIFVILHYNNARDTLDCIKSLKKFKSKIVVVSNSHDYENLKKIESKVDKLIINDDNIGFAKANNIGCKFAIKNYNPDYICVINNDIIINQKDFVKKINDLYNEYEFDVLGPKILPLETDSNNPFPAYKSLEEIRKKIKYTERLIKVYKSPFKRNLLNLYLKIKIKNKNKKDTQNNEDILGEPLHGCALIFSKKYYKKYKDVFYNDTYLFHEEEFLYYRCKHDNLVFLYSPSIELIHKEGMSLNNRFNNNYEKMIFRNEEILKSLKKLEDVYMKGVAI